MSLVIEPRLSMSTYSGYSTVAWYLIAAPSDGLMIAAFLNGQTSPTIETADVEFNKLGMQMRCFLDVGMRFPTRGPAS